MSYSVVCSKLMKKAEKSAKKGGLAGVYYIPEPVRKRALVIYNENYEDTK